MTIPYPYRTPDALPFGVAAACFDYCPPIPPCEVHWLPSPCICTTQGFPGFPGGESGGDGGNGGDGGGESFAARARRR